METLTTRLTLEILLVSVFLPVVAVLVAYWGSTWGWNSDGLLSSQAPIYLVAGYVLFPVPVLVLSRLWTAPKLARFRSRRQGIAGLAWGLYVATSSLVLIHLFSSEALWLGSVGVIYLAFAVTVVSTIHLLA